MTTTSSAFCSANAASLPPFSSADQRRAAGHLSGDDIGLRMVLAAGIDDLGHLRLLGEEVGEAGGVFRLLAHAQRHSVSAPFSSVQALNGESAGPVWRK